MKYVVTTLVPLFLIGSSSFLQITRTTIKYRMGIKKIYQSRFPTAELAALERLENPNRLMMGEML